jgi:hypothetical protein
MARYRDLNSGDSFQVVYPNGTRGDVEWFPVPGMDRETEVIRLGYGRKSREQFQAEQYHARLRLRLSRPAGQAGQL